MELQEGDEENDQREMKEKSVAFRTNDAVSWIESLMMANSILSIWGPWKAEESFHMSRKDKTHWVPWRSSDYNSMLPWRRA